MATIIPPLDLMFFLTETPQSPKHVGAVQVFQLPADAPETYLRDLVAEFKAAPAVSPFNCHPHFPRVGMPRWREDKEIEMNYHVRHSALPAPGSNQQLMDVVQRLHATMLDRRRPCWMCQFIEGLEGNRFAIYSKVHHAYIDGMSGVKRMYGSLSTSPSEQKVVASWSYQPESSAGRSGQARRHRASTGDKLLSQAKGLVEASAFLGNIGLQWLKLRGGNAQIPFSASRTRMNRTIEWDTRSTAVCTFQLDQIKAIGHQRGCTVNEVVLAIIGAALDDYLEEHRENAQAPLVAMCPMSLRSEGDDSAKTQVSAVHVSLGEPTAGISERLDQVIESSQAAKEAVSGLSTEAMMDYGVIIFGLWELLSRTGLERYVTPSYNVLVSNVPGPGDEHMYLRGSRLEASYPISAFLPGVNLNATLLSHGNKLDFGLLGDMHALPDLDMVVERMAYRLAQLEREVLGKADRSGPKKAPARARKKSVSRAKMPVGRKPARAKKAAPKRKSRR
jgi:diacylglycerol O-acyltransferase